MPRVPLDQKIEYLFKELIDFVDDITKRKHIQTYNSLKGKSYFQVDFSELKQDYADLNSSIHNLPERMQPKANNLLQDLDKRIINYQKNN